MAHFDSDPDITELMMDVEDLEQTIETQKKEIDALKAPRSCFPLSDWHEDDGPVLWWKFPVEEPPYVGTPLDPIVEPISFRLKVNGVLVSEGVISLGGWPGYHTHWTRIQIPEEPKS